MLTFSKPVLRFFLGCFLFFPVSQLVEAQSFLDQPIRLSFSSHSISEILEEIEASYQIDFYYAGGQLPTDQLRIDFQDIPLRIVLDGLLKDTNLGYAPYEDYAVIIVPRKDLELEFTQDFYQIKYGEVVEETEQILQDQVDLGDPNDPAPGGKAKITGSVTDATTQEPLIGVALFIPSLNKAVVTGSNGTYSWELPIGDHQLTIQSIGYEEYLPLIQVYNDAEWNIELLPRTYDFQAVVVTETATDENITSAQIGLERLSVKEIQSLPSLLGEPDVIRSLLSLPGINTVGEGATGFNVRGGNIDQNLVLQDGSPVYNTSHVLGFFSIFNPDLIRSVNLYKGNIPAQFGGRIASLLEVETIDADPEQFHIRGGIGIVSNKLTMEIPLIKGSTSLLVGGRGSYTDWILSTIRQNEDVRNSSTYFYDLNAKLTHQFKDGSNISLGYYRSRDFFRYSRFFGFQWGLQTGNLNWNQILADGLSFNFSANYGDTENQSFDPDGLDAFELNTGLRTYKVRQNFFITLLEGHEIHVGGEWQRTEQTPEILQPTGEESAVIPQSVKKDQGHELAFYVNDEFNLGARLTISAGLRYTRYQQKGEEQLFQYSGEGLPELDNLTDTLFFGAGEVVQTYAVWEPRVSLRYRLGLTNSVKLSYNRLHQFIHLVSNTVAATPIDIWQLSTPYIPPQRSDNYSLGYFQNFNDNEWETSFELFYRDMDQLVEVRDLPQILLNDHIETDLLPAVGRAYGAELSFRRTKGRTTGRLSYAFTRSLRRTPGEDTQVQVNDGEWYPSNFDQPHSLKFNLSHQVNKRHTFSANFVFNSGRPITVPIGNFFIGPTPVPLYSDRNAFRIPAYHRLDLSYTIRRNAVRTKRYKGSLTFSIYNVYARRNVFTIFFQRDISQAVQAYQFSILGTALPAVTYNFTF